MTSQSPNLMDLPEEILDNITDCLTAEVSDYDDAESIVLALAALSTSNRTLRRICSSKLYAESQRHFPHRILVRGILSKNLDVVKWVFRMSEALNCTSGGEGGGEKQDEQNKESNLVNVVLGAPRSHLLRHGTSLITSAISNSWAYSIFTPLHLAACAGSIPISHFLLCRGADVSAKGRDRDEGCHPRGHDTAFPTPLHMALCHGHEELALFLLERGKAPVQTDLVDRHRTALTDAVYTRRTEFAKLLLKKGFLTEEMIREHGNNLLDRRTPLVLTAAAGYHDPEMVGFLIQNGADPSEEAQWFVPDAFRACLESRLPALLVRRVSSSGVGAATAVGGRVPGEEGGGDEEEGRSTGLRTQHRFPSISNIRVPSSNTRNMPGTLRHCSLEALCDGFIKARVISQSKPEPPRVSSGSYFISDDEFDGLCKTAEVLLKAGGGKELRRKGKFHHCMRGLLVNCLRSYRPDLNFGRIAKGILEVVEPPEFYGDDIVPAVPVISNDRDGTEGDKLEQPRLPQAPLQGPRGSAGEPVLSSFLFSAFEIYDFRLFHVIASYVARKNYTQTIQHFLAHAPRMIVRIAWRDYNRTNTLTGTLNMWSAHFVNTYVPANSGLDRDVYGNVVEKAVVSGGGCNAEGNGKIGENGEDKDSGAKKPILGPSTEVALEAIRYIRLNFESHLDVVLPYFPDQDPDPDPDEPKGEPDEREPHNPVDNHEQNNPIHNTAIDASLPLPPTGGTTFWSSLQTKKTLVEASDRGWFDGESKPKAYAPADRFWRELSVQDIKNITADCPSFESVFPDGERVRFRRWLAESRAAVRFPL